MDEAKWMAVEVMGHRQHVGLVREVTQFGATFMSVEALQRDGTFTGPIAYSGSAIFSYRTITEEQARKAALAPAYFACSAFAQPSAIPGLCATCGLDEPAHVRATAKALTEGEGEGDALDVQEPEGDDVPY